VPAAGGTPTLLVKLDDRSARDDFATNGKRFFFLIGHHQSDIFVMDLQSNGNRRRSQDLRQ
jgi:hypothetical protein